MKKQFFMFCLSALVFAGCKKASSPEKIIDNDGGLVRTFCTENPDNDLCKALEGKTELTPQEVKPVMRLTSKTKDPLYGASNPNAWKKGYFNLPRKDENGGLIYYMVDFSVEDGSVLTAGMPFQGWALNMTAGTISPIAANSVASGLGGVTWEAHTNIDKWGPVSIKIVVFENLGKYFFTPTLRFAP